MIIGIFINRRKNSGFKMMYLITEDWYFLSHSEPLAQACRDLGCEIVIATCVHRHGETIRGRAFSLIPIQMDRRRNVFGLPHDIFYQRLFWFFLGLVLFAGARSKVRTTHPVHSPRPQEVRLARVAVPGSSDVLSP